MQPPAWRAQTCPRVHSHRPNMSASFDLAHRRVPYRFFWVRHVSRHDDDIALDCAQKAGGRAFVELVQDEIEQLKRNDPSRSHD